MVSEYQSFLERKAPALPSFPVEHGELTPSLFPHQSDLTRWALRRGRAAIFASTGLGKSRMSLEWVRHVVEHTGKPALILTPLAVSQQMVEEGAELGVEVTHCRWSADVKPGVNVTNYDRLHLFDSSMFGGVVLDEASCIKHQDTKRLALLLEAFSDTPYRLSATATPAPNDYTELGTQAEFLGICTRQEMLAEYFGEVSRDKLEAMLEQPHRMNQAELYRHQMLRERWSLAYQRKRFGGG